MSGGGGFGATHPRWYLERVRAAQAQLAVCSGVGQQGEGGGRAGGGGLELRIPRAVSDLLLAGPAAHRGGGGQQGQPAHAPEPLSGAELLAAVEAARLQMDDAYERLVRRIPPSHGKANTPFTW